MSARDYPRRINGRRKGPGTQCCARAHNLQQLQRFGRSGYERNVDDRVIRVDRSQLSAIGRMVIDVVVMRRWTMLVGSGVHDGMHMQLGRLQVHQREPGNQRDREHPTECRYHLLLPSYYIRGGGGTNLALMPPW